MRDLGHAVGTAVVLEPRSANGDPAQLPPLAAELAARNVGVIVAVGPAAVAAARAATQSIPIVAIDLETNPVTSGWAKSLARPGGNLTGLFLDHPAIAGKWLDLLGQVVPRLRRVSVIRDASTGTTQVDATREAAKSLGLELQLVTARDGEDLSRALESIRTDCQALLMLSSPMIFAKSAVIAAYTSRRRLPAISPFRPFPVAGGLMSYGPDLPYFFRRSALYVDKLLKGAPVADLPIEQPTNFFLVVNATAASALGLAIPQSVLLRADEVLRP